MNPAPLWENSVVNELTKYQARFNHLSLPGLWFFQLNHLTPAFKGVVITRYMFVKMFLEKTLILLIYAIFLKRQSQNILSVTNYLSPVNNPLCLHAVTTIVIG